MTLARGALIGLSLMMSTACVSEGLFAMSGAGSTAHRDRGPERAGAARPGAARVRVLFASLHGTAALVPVACSDGRTIWVANCIEALGPVEQVRALDGTRVEVVKREQQRLDSHEVASWMRLPEPVRGTRFYSWPPDVDLHAIAAAAPGDALPSGDAGTLVAAMALHNHNVVAPATIHQAVTADLDGDGTPERTFVVDAMDQNISARARALFREPAPEDTPVFLQFTWLYDELAAAVDLAGDGRYELAFGEGLKPELRRWADGTLEAVPTAPSTSPGFQ